MYVEVLRVVDVLVCAGLDTIYYSGFEIEEDRAWDVSSIVGLVEEDVFSIAAFCCEVFEVPILVDSMFAAKLLPEFASNYLNVSSVVGRLSLWLKTSSEVGELVVACGWVWVWTNRYCRIGLLVW